MTTKLVHSVRQKPHDKPHRFEWEAAFGKTPVQHVAAQAELPLRQWVAPRSPDGVPAESVVRAIARRMVINAATSYSRGFTLEGFTSNDPDVNKAATWLDQKIQAGSMPTDPDLYGETP